MDRVFKKSSFLQKLLFLSLSYICYSVGSLHTPAGPTGLSASSLLSCQLVFSFLFQIYRQGSRSQDSINTNTCNIYRPVLGHIHQRPASSSSHHLRHWRLVIRRKIHGYQVPCKYTRELLPSKCNARNFLGVLHKQIRFHMEKLGQPTLSTILLNGNLTRQEKGRY